MSEEREIFPDDLYEAMELQAFIQSEIDDINLSLSVFFEREEPPTQDELDWRHRAGRAKLHRHKTMRLLSAHIVKLRDQAQLKAAAEKQARKAENLLASESDQRKRNSKILTFLAGHYPDVHAEVLDMLRKEVA